MTRWDGVLINACAALLVDPIFGEDRVRDIEFVRQALPRASWNDARLQPVLRAATALVDAWCGEPGGERAAAWVRARYDATGPVATILRWRTAELLRDQVNERGAA